MSNNKGISPSYCMYKILMKDNYKPVIQPQRRLNPKVQDVVKNEIVKLLDSGFFQISIAPEDQEKTMFTCTYGTFAYRRMPFRLCNAPATFQRCMTMIFHDMVEDFMEVFMDDFLVFVRMLARCEETNIVLNWEKCHFMVKEGIVLGHKIYGAGIEVDRSKIDVIAKLLYPTNMKVVRRFLGHAGFYQSIFKDAKGYIMRCDACQRSENISSRSEMPQNNIQVEAQALPTNDACVVIKFLRRLFIRFGVPKALITYHPQTNGQIEVTNRAIKRILERSVGYNLKNWSKKLDDALWAFKTAYKTPTGCTPFRLVYGKACHLPVEIENKAYWALKQCNIDLTAAAKNCFMKLNKLIEFRDGAYENTRIYKERTKKWHDSRLHGDKNFKVGDKLLLFNSRLKMHPGKLKSRLYGPNMVKIVYPYGTIEIVDKNKISFKVNGQRLKKYHDEHTDAEDKEVVEFEQDTT
ncbi:reverse transcriptase domain-containing protein [Tanacetum coccineum]